jgi:hypothetical protein
MNKLELKHLAPYLPYGLKVKHDFQKVRYNGRKSPLEDWIMTLEPSMLNCFILKDKRPFNRKPILRPLSDLSKDQFKMDEISKGAILFLSDIGKLPYNSMKSHIGGIMYRDMIKLFEWHFDVFGLIDQGLAIDINTLKNV